MTLFDRVLVPLSNEADAVRTAEGLLTYLDGREGDMELLLLHVIEKGGGTIDKAPLPATEQQARDALNAARLVLESEGYSVRTEVEYGTNVVEKIHETATERGVTAIVFRPRKRGLLTRLVGKSKTTDLVRNAPCPVVSLPNGSE